MVNEQENLNACEAFENRRKFPRLKMNMPIIIIGPDGKKFKGLLHDISPDSAQVKLSTSKGIKMVPDMESPMEKIKSMKCTLLFDLAYSGNIAHVKLGAYPLYLSQINNGKTASGMLFSEDDLAENKKVSDFLFYQLAMSFIESEYQVENKPKKIPAIEAKEKIIEVKKLQVQKEESRNIPSELNELVLNIDHSKTDLELLKVLLYRVLNNLHTIQETARHIEERIRALEHKTLR